jgi:lipopolysaccharide transport system ATP-binding protein
MSDIAIRIENLGKRYRYGGAAPLSANLRADITDWIKGMMGRSSDRVAGLQGGGQSGGAAGLAGAGQACRVTEVQRGGGAEGKRANMDGQDLQDGGRVTEGVSGGEGMNGGSRMTRHASLHEIHERHLDADPNYFWALKDINLEIKQGEVVGIIGRNGAGKSTLLKILSRITPPTTGKIIYRGRMASLLEVGTGFHRELTGRENIYLNGSILGMKRAEIVSSFDEIVAFAEVEKFIDTPVKFYSSGMYVRLAFAVAAHLNVEILAVDEVLAVGDADFQRKCLGRMGDVARGGRTVLLVSHNMAALMSLCTQCAVIQSGSLVGCGEPQSTIRSYLGQYRSSALNVEARTDRGGDGTARLLAIRIASSRGGTVVASGEDVFLELLILWKVCSPPFVVKIGIYDQLNAPMLFLDSADVGLQFRVGQGRAKIVCHMRSVNLVPGVYAVNVAIAPVHGGLADHVVDAARLTIEESNVYGVQRRGGGNGAKFMVLHSWEMHSEDGDAAVN